MRCGFLTALLLSGCSILFDPSASGDAGSAAEDAAETSDGGDPIGDAGGDWLDPGWAHRKRITLNSDLIPADLPDFPVLISISSDQDLTAAQARGDDILFTSSDGKSVLDHEIGHFDSDKGDLRAWVRLDTLPSTVDTTLFLYYGNPDAQNDSDGSDVWRNGFLRVYHVKGSQSEPPYLHDSTGNHDATLKKGVYTPVPGKVGNGVYVDALPGCATEPICGTEYDVGNGDLSGAWSLSAWIYHVSFTDTYSDLHVLDQDYVPNAGSAGIIGYWDGSEVDNWDDTPEILTGSWYYYVWNYDGSNLVGRVNGVSSQQTESIPTMSTDALLQIGSTNTPADEYQDEIRYSSVSRSPAWTETEYNNMNAPGEFHSVGLQEDAP